MLVGNTGAGPYSLTEIFKISSDTAGNSNGYDGHLVDPASGFPALCRWPWWLACWLAQKAEKRALLSEPHQLTKAPE